MCFSSCVFCTNGVCLSPLRRLCIICAVTGFLPAEKYKAHILKYVPGILKYLRPFFEKVPEGFSGLFYGN